MSATASATAHAKYVSTRKKYEEYCKRPEGEEPNTGIPRYGYYVQHALYPTLAIVLKAMWSLNPVELAGGRGAIIRNASNLKIARATAKFTGGLPMPLRTVGHCLDALAKRRIAIPWDANAAPAHSPFGRSWRLPRYAEILDLWAADEKIFTVGKRAFYVRGKGRRHMSPEEVVSWGMDHAAAEKLRSMHASASDAEEPLSSDEAKGATLGEEIDAVHAAIAGDIRVFVDGGLVGPEGTRGQNAFGVNGLDATPEQAAAIIQIAREAAPAIPVSEIATLIHEIRAAKATADRGSRKPTYTNVGWVIKGMAASAHTWRLGQRDKASA